jgi:IS30 family transposase
MLRRRWSPKIIAQELGHIISHMTIYNIINTIRREWRKFLIYQRKCRYHKGSAGRALIPNRIDISERPETKFGDWEADTVVPGRGGKAVLGVFVEKTTRIYKVVKMMNKTADEMLRATLVALDGLPVRSITYDNGSENAAHEWANRLLGCQSYFARPYRSTDKAQIENRNKILRQFLPKGTNFDLITESELSRIEAEINERPMECLGWRSPSEALALHSKF